MIRIGPLSPELVTRLALVAAGLGVAWYLYRRATEAAGAVADQVSQVADAVIVGVNPANPDNWVNQAVSAAGSAIVSDDGPGRNADGSWSLGGALFDMTHWGWADQVTAPSPASSAGTVAGGTPMLIPTDYTQLSNLGAP